MTFTTEVGAATPTSTGTTPSIPAARLESSPFGWTAASAEQRLIGRRRDRGPRLRQLMGVCGWAAVLGGIGLIIAIRGIWGVITTTPPSWYEPAVTVAGLTGIAFTVAAFATVQRRRLPWALLAMATVFLGAAMVFTANAF